MAGRKKVKHIVANDHIVDDLQRLKFRFARKSDEMLSTLIYLAGDITRYIQHLEGGDEDMQKYELGNIKFRLKELEKMNDDGKDSSGTGK